MQSLSLAAERPKGLKEGIQGCRQQILSTPMDQAFLHILREDLVVDFHKSPAMMDPLAKFFEKVMQEGHLFLLKNYVLEDVDGVVELGEMLDSLSDPLEILGGDSSLPPNHPWWLPAMTWAVALFTAGLFIDPDFTGWREILYPVVSLLKEWLHFFEVGTGEIAEPSAILPPPSDKVSSVPATGALAILPDDVSHMIESVLLRLPLDVSPTKMTFVSPTGTPLRLLAPDSALTLLLIALAAPDQEGEHDLHPKPSKNALASMSGTTTKTSVFPSGFLLICLRLKFSHLMTSNNIFQ